MSKRGGGEEAHVLQERENIQTECPATKPTQPHKSTAALRLLPSGGQQVNLPWWFCCPRGAWLP